MNARFAMRSARHDLVSGGGVRGDDPGGGGYFRGELLVVGPAVNAANEGMAEIK